MEKLFGIFAFGVVLALISPLVGVLLGSFTGWIVGLFFTETILGFLARLGVDTAGLAIWQIGASMGFLGGFLKTTVHQKS